MIFNFIDILYQKRLVLLLAASIVVVACGKTDISDSEHLQRAKQYQEAGDVRASFIELKSALQQNPKNSEARLMLGELYVLVGNGAAAEKEITRAKNLGINNNYVVKLLFRSLLAQKKYDDALGLFSGRGESSDPEVFVLIGDAHLGNRDFDGAKKFYERANSIDASNLEARLGMGWVYLRTGKLEKAKGMADDVLLKNPVFSDAHSLAAEIHFQRGQFKEAVTSYKNAIGDSVSSIVTRDQFANYVGLIRAQMALQSYDDALNNINIILKSYPKHPVPMYLMALYSYQNENYQNAKEYLQKVLSISPNHTQSLLLAGSVDYALGNLQQSETYLAQYLSVVPSNIAARKLMGMVQLKLNDAEKALEYLTDVAIKGEQDVMTLALIGDAAIRSGDIEKGIKFLGKAVSKRPEDNKLRLALAHSYAQSGDIDQALKELEAISGDGPVAQQAEMAAVILHLRKKSAKSALDQALKLVAKYPESAPIISLAGGVYLTQGDRSRAVEFYNMALEKDQNYVPALLNLARLYLQDGRLSQAEKMFLNVLALKSTNAVSMMGLSQVSEQKGDTAAALSWLEEARAANESYFLPRLILGKYYLDTGLTDKANKAAQEAQKIMPNNPAALLLMGRIQLATGQALGAEKTLKQLTEAMPKAAGTYFEYAKANVASGNLKAAKISLAKSLELYPDFFQAQAALSIVDLKLGQSSQALRRSESLLKQKPNLPFGYLARSEIYLEKNDLKGAQKILEEGQQRAPSASLVKKLVDVYTEQGKTKAAVEVLEAWSVLHPEDIEILTKLGVAYQQANNFSKAKNYYELVLAKEKNNLAVVNNMAMLLLSLGQKSDALEFAERAYGLNPSSISVVDTLAWINLENGSNEKAYRLFQGVKENIRSPSMQYHYAVSLEKVGKLQEARKELKGLLATDKAFDDRAAAEKLYKTLTN